METVNPKDLFGQLENTMREFIKEKLEMVMKEELAAFLTVEHEDIPNRRNGTYTRTMDTRFGHIDDLQVPRDRAGYFQSQVFEPYKRREPWVEDAVIHMYRSGMSTREVGEFMHRILGHTYSAATVSNITESVHEDIVKWQQRPLPPRMSVLFLDALYVKVRRDEVGQEAIYLVMGITEEGKRQVLSFHVGGRENSLTWKDVLLDLHRRGLKEVLLGVFDGLAGLENSFTEVYPKADIQRCVVHKVRNTLNHVRQKDQAEVAADLKAVYTQSTATLAKEVFKECVDKWQKRYPKEMESWERDLPNLLTFLHYPQEIREFIYTTNWIERMNKEFRKRLKTMNSLSTIYAAEKIVYLKAEELNYQWDRKLRGFSTAQPKLQEMFEERYGKVNNQPVDK